MTEHPEIPREYDAVKGGQPQVPLGAAVLGGISGVKSRLASPIFDVKIAALSEALKYGDAGLDLIIETLLNESMMVKLAAYSLLKDRDEPKIKGQLLNYLPSFEFDTIAVDSEGKEIDRNRHLARYFPEELGNSIVLEMVYIPGGSFMMGSPATQSDRYDETPQHQVTIPAFYASKYPITQAQWQTVTGKNPSWFRGAQLPVEHISWDDAVEFCRQLSQQTGKQYRLLSEAEWEYACRAGTTTPFHFGETITPELVNYRGDYPYANAPTGIYRQKTIDVGSFSPNTFGLYDMHGNITEWCSDRWHENYNGAPTDGTSWETGGCNFRVLRGGCWLNYAVGCRSTIRNRYSPQVRFWSIGFRVACTFP
ncbi:MAG: formylglycine-generating enzyme family protein [Microcoleus sp.]